MIERAVGTPDAQAMEAMVAEAPLRFEEFFDAEHARLFGAQCFVTGDRPERRRGVDGSDPRLLVAGTSQGDWLSP